MPDHATHDANELLASPIRRRIVERLAISPAVPGRESGGRSAAELATDVGLHVTTVRFHLDQLTVAGIVTAATEHREGAGRPRKVYRLPPGFQPEDSTDGAFEALATLLATTWGGDEDGEPITPVEAGARWARTHARSALDVEGTPAPARSPGQWLGKVGLMLDVLRDWGYHPQVSADRDGRQVQIELIDCPFFDLARAQPDVVCGVHRGLLTGSMDALGENDVDIGLTAFVDSRTCLARLTRRAPFPTRPVKEQP